MPPESAFTYGLINSSKWNSECVGRFLVGKSFDCNEVKDGPLLLRQIKEGAPDLLEPNRTLLGI